MERHEIVSKLTALRNNVAKFIENLYAHYFDPQYVMDLFHRYIPIRDELLSKYSSLFRDLPVRETPKPSETTDFNGRGYIEREKLDLLLKDIEYCIDILSNIPSVDIPWSTSSSRLLSAKGGL